MREKKKPQIGTFDQIKVDKDTDLKEISRKELDEITNKFTLLIYQTTEKRMVLSTMSKRSITTQFF